MNDNDFDTLLKDVVSKCVRLKDKHVEEKNLVIDWICVFAQSDSQYKNLVEHASQWGHVVDNTHSGPVFRFDKPLITIAGIPNVLKIRIPDPSKPELGDVDFSTDYETFKNKYLDGKHFTLITREKFEMIELRENKSEVICYFSSIPPSKLVN